MTQPRKITCLLVVAVTASALVSLAIHRRLLAPAAAREEAFDAIVASKLTADSRGLVTLPENLRAASIDGNAYVTGSRDLTLWALFLAEKGDGAQLRGYLFCSKPAAARATGAVTLRYPAAEGGNVDVTVQRVLNPSCFEVVHQRR